MKNRNKLFTSIAILGSAIFGMVLTAGTGVFEALGLFNNTRTGSSTSTTNLILNKDNAYSSGSNQAINTTFGKNPIIFDYSSGCSSFSGAHVNMADGATVGNYWKTNDKNSGINWNNKLTSIESIKPVFNAESGASLQFRASYDGKTSGAWGNFAPLTSNTTFSLASNPYYIELKAVGGSVSLTSCEICFSCIENTSATGTPKYETQVSVNGGESRSYGVDKSFDSLIPENPNKATRANSDKPLDIKATLSDGSQKTLYKGEFTYTVTNSSGSQITTSQPFGTAGDYTAHIKYGNLPTFDYSFNVADNLIESITLSGNTSINTGANGKITASISPSNATHKELTWESGDTDIVTVDGSGNIHAVGPGTTTITASAQDGSGKSGSISVTVTDIAVTSVTLDKTSLTMYYEDADVTLHATVSPENATHSTVTWLSSVPSVATVTNGVVHPVAAGSTNITATADGVTATCAVTVTATKPEWVIVKDEDELISGHKYIIAYNDEGTTAGDISNSVMETVSSTFSNEDIPEKITTVGEGTIELTLGGSEGAWTFTYDDSLLGATAVKKLAWDGGTTTWSISIDSAYDATISNTTSSYGHFLYNGGSPRFTTYTSSVGNGMYAVQLYTLKSNAPVSVTGVSVSLSSSTIYAGGTANATATVAPPDADNKEVTWSLTNVSPAGCATIDPSTGVVTGVSAGTATVVATSQENNEISGSASITINAVTLESISISGYTTQFTVGDTFSFGGTVTANYNNGTHTDVTNSASFSGYNMSNTGNQTVTVTYGVETTTYQITVSAVVHPSSVSLSSNSETIAVGGSVTLTETVLPNNAANKSVTWSSNDTGVATVTNGVVTGVSEGTATITVTTVDGNKTDTCLITVEDSSGGEVEDMTFNIYNISSGGSNTGYDAAAGDYNISATGTYTVNLSGVCIADSQLQFRRSSKGAGVIYSKTEKSISKITLSPSSATNTLTLYSGSLQNPTSGEVAASNGVYTLNGAKYFTLVNNTDSVVKLDSIVVSVGEDKPTNPTGISIPSTASVGVGQKTTLEVTYSPSGCNRNKGITWSISDTNPSGCATINASTGEITGVSVGTATITATSTFNSSFTSSCTVTVTEQQGDDWTILFYICGADLESGGGRYATSDLNEIKSVSNKPDDVNIVVETGGAKSWGNNQNNCIDKDHLCRFELGSNGSYISKSKISNADMRKSSTLQSFVEWGIENYPADKIGLVLWDHGGAMDGVCFDEIYEALDDEENPDYQALTSEEVATACTNAINNKNNGKKLEFIGYDACLMSVQDIAGKNAAFSNYMIASEESEDGYGWNYDAWLDNVYEGDSTEDILTEICDTFIDEQGPSSDQTLSWMDLSKWSTYEAAWEDMASYLSSSIIKNKSDWNTFKTVVNKAKKYGYCDTSDADEPNWSLKYNNGYLYDIFDAQDFIDQMQKDNTYKSNTTLQTKLSACETALTGANGLIGCNRCGTAAGNSYGLCMFCPLSGYNASTEIYTSSMTTLTYWRSLCIDYGSWWQ